VVSVSPDTLTRLPPEKELRQCVVDTARLLNWLVYFTQRSERSPAGFPDLILVRGETVLWVELKRNARGRLRPEQRVWATRLQRAGQDWRRWTWADWFSGEVERVLKGD
jgi:hypothetical protein